MKRNVEILLPLLASLALIFALAACSSAEEAAPAARQHLRRNRRLQRLRPRPQSLNRQPEQEQQDSSRRFLRLPHPRPPKRRR